MKKRNFSFVAAWFVLQSAHAFAGHTEQGVAFRSYHSDYRKTPKLEEFKDATQKGSLAPEDAARAFLADRASDYGIKDLKQLTLKDVKESLLGKHFYFEQAVDSVNVENGEIVVSVSNKTNEVYRAYNNFFPGQEQTSSKAKRAILSTNKAFDIAWQDLKVHGKLQSAPTTKLVYRVTEKGEFKLVYVTFLNTDAPFGAWEHEIDAYTGKVLSRVDTALERKAPKYKADPSLYNGPILDRESSFAAFENSQKAMKKSFGMVAPADGKGLVFDPDPRTTLNNPNLADNSPAASFDAAYFERDLLDLSFDGTTYKLEGPWVKIGDFESPPTPPSTSTTGQWTAKRGNNAFNDAMTYYHIDKNQRYMQSLGFTGTRAIQGGPIQVDSNGLNGDDNSHYIPGTNQMAFGHGCVDDNEDSDVILHEYGHAINKSINDRWNGGDTGAMGEGFGDYWAGSYSMSTAEGRAFNPTEVFSWDGHGPGNPCWPGRIMNATNLMYNHTSNYGAHQSIGGERQSDELWSTPLFQALTALISQGVPREEVDQIILEAQFGLGAGLKMRDLANATITTAKRLQPGKPHASVFIQKFAAQQIVDVPQAVLALDHLNMHGTGNNEAVDPGETVTLSIHLKNRGTLVAEGLQATLTSATTGVTILSGQSTFNNADMGDVVENSNELSFSIASNAACGSSVKLALTVTYTGGTQSNVVIPVEFNLGTPIGISGAVNEVVAIPDNNPTGVTSVISVNNDGIVTSNLTVDVNIQHTYIGDLLVVLTAPNGTKVNLHKRTGSGAANINGRYPTTLTPNEPLSALVGKPIRGDWKLTVSDAANSDTGKLLSWGLNDVNGYQCE